MRGLSSLALGAVVGARMLKGPQARGPLLNPLRLYGSSTQRRSGRTYEQVFAPVLWTMRALGDAPFPGKWSPMKFPTGVLCAADRAGLGAPAVRITTLTVMARTAVSPATKAQRVFRRRRVAAGVA